MMDRTRFLLILGSIVLLLALGGLGVYRGLLGVRVSAPALTSTTLGGQLVAGAVSSGSHTLEFRATTTDGQQLSDTVTFSVPTSTAGFSGLLAYTDDSQLLKLGRQRSDGQWDIETVSAVTGVHEPDITRDAQGAVHLVYTENQRLVYATNAGGTWHTQVIDGPADYISRQTLAVDKNGKAHVVYMSLSLSQSSGLKYATNSSGEWQSTKIPTTAAVDMHRGNMAVGTDGVVQVVYHDENGLSSYATRDTSGTWRTEPMGITLAPPRFMVLALDGQNHPHLLYEEQSDQYAVRYAELSGSTWQPETIKRFSNLTFTSAEGDMTVDSAGRPHIILAGQNQQGSYEHVYISRDSGEAWVELPVEPAQPVGSLPFSAGHMVQTGDDSSLVYRRYADNKVLYAHCNYGTSCSTGEVRLSPSSPSTFYYEQLVP